MNVELSDWAEWGTISMLIKHAHIPQAIQNVADIVSLNQYTQVVSIGLYMIMMMVCEH